MRSLGKYPAAVLLALLVCSSAFAAEGPMNFVFLDLCSTRADHFGTYGYTRDTTPNMDSVGKSGVVFENALSEGSWCLPSYASLLTGHVPEVHGQYTSLPARKLPPFETTLAEMLKTKGYQTALFSGGVYLLPEWGLSKGFDSYIDLFSTSTPNRIPAPFEDNFDHIVDWIKTNQNQDRPFFLFAAIDNMHVPYHAKNPDKYDPGYQGIAHDTDVISVPFARAYNGEPSGYPDYMLEKVKEFKSDPRNLKNLIAHYDAALSEVDQQIGDFVKKLKEMGLDKNTVLIISADHGEMLGEKGLLNHTQGLYEPNIHVPLIIRDPEYASQAGRRVKQLVQRIDLMPTLLEMAQVPAPQSLELQGKSLVSLLEDPKAPWRELAFVRSKRNLARLTDLNIDERVVRGACWKLHHYLYKDGYELYDICKDPLETNEVSKQNPAEVSRLSFALLKNVEYSRPHQPGLPSGRTAEGSLIQPAPKD
jgi:arylsulfatase A-like enzyme